MHGAVPEWIQHCLERISVPTSVLDLGGRDVNGTVKHLFPNASRYLVLDIRPGHNVDIVADAATYQTDEKFDLVLCTECIEHVLPATAAAICANAYRLLNKDGHFILTTATLCRDPHSAVDGRLLQPYQWTDDPELLAREPHRESYHNISEMELSNWLFDAGFGEYATDVTGCDVRALAAKR